MEAYRALGDMHDGMDLTERLIVECARHAADKLQFAQGDVAIDLTPPFPRRCSSTWSPSSPASGSTRARRSRRSGPCATPTA